MRYEVANRCGCPKATKAAFETVRPSLSKKLFELGESNIARQERQLTDFDWINVFANSDIVENRLHRRPNSLAFGFVRMVEQIVNNFIREEVRSLIALRIAINEQDGLAEQRQGGCDVYR
jgi:hypothetical protein